MTIQNITTAQEPIIYDRLRMSDINRVPKFKLKDKNDTCTLTPAQKQQKPKKKNVIMEKIFTVATFGIVTLLVAHKNNMFNPIKREVKKLLRNEEFLKEIRNYTNATLSEDFYKKALKSYLEKIVTEKSRDELFIGEIKKVISDKKIFNELLEEIKKGMEKEKLSKTEIKDGFYFDLMENLKVKLEKDLLSNKRNNLPYLDQSANILASLFKTSENSSPVIEELLKTAVNNRNSNTVEKFINNRIIETKLNTSA